jgi:hypothetical protein
MVLLSAGFDDGANLMATVFTAGDTSAQIIAVRNSTLPAHGPLTNAFCCAITFAKNKHPNNNTISDFFIIIFL